MSDSGNNSDCDVSCSHCGRKFSQRKNLYAHIRQFHPGEDVDYKLKGKIICCLCDEEKYSMPLYIDHIHSKHPEVPLSFEKKFFYSDEDFDNWRWDLEEYTGTHFAVSRSKIKLADGRIRMQYKCDRSGIYRKQASDYKRKFAGSKKIGKTCPSYMSVTKTIVDDLMEIEVNSQALHAGHTFDMHSLHCSNRRKVLRGKARRIKKMSDLKRHSMDQEVYNICVDDKTKSHVKVVSDIFSHDSQVQVQEMSCSCKPYNENLMCEHIETICQSLNLEISTKAVSDDSSNVTDSLFVDVSEGDMLGDITNVREDLRLNTITKSLQEQKSSVIMEFQQLIEKCQNLEQLSVWKSIIEEGKFKLSASR